MIKTIEKTENAKGERFLALRSYYKLTQEQFGHLIGLTSVAVGRIESGKTKNPQQETLEAAARALGASSDWLDNGTGEMLPNGPIDLKKVKQNGDATETNWKSEAYLKLEQQVQYLQGLVTTLVNSKGGNANFHKALKNKVAGGKVIQMIAEPLDLRAQA